MSWINRYYEQQFPQMMEKGKVLVIFGSRQVGKTSLINHMLEKDKEIFRGDGNDMNLQEILNSMRLSTIQNALQGFRIVIIDEAQKVTRIGDAIKLFIDANPETSVILSGSSSFDLSGKIGEPLTGRQKVYTLFPVSVMELVESRGRMAAISDLDNILVFGSYPETLTLPNNEQRIEYLINLRNSYLLKDILELENIRNPSKLFDLLRLLAYQVGNEVSLNELSNQLSIAKQTVDRYIYLLEEITKTHRYYFWDNGIRNALINNFNPFPLRNDQGMLWENFLFIERLKTREYLKIPANNYFWRTYDQKEIDMVEERDGKLYAYEFKLSAKNLKAPKLWIETYKNAEFKVIHRENFMEFLLVDL